MFSYVRNYLVFRYGDAVHVRKFSHTDGNYFYFDAEEECLIGFPAQRTEVLYVTPTLADARAFAGTLST